MRAIHRLFIAVVRVLVSALFKVHVQGIEHVPPEGAVILAANHINSSDAFIVWAIMPRDIIAWSKAEIWGNPLLRVLANAMQLIPLRRGELDLHAVRLALKALAAGRALGVAPEGTRSWHGRLQRGRPGLVFLAQRAPGTLVLPTAVFGQELFGENARRLRRTSVQAVFGQGFHLALPEGAVSRETRQEIIDEVMAQIAALLPPANRGVYADLTAADERHLVFPPGTTSSLQRALKEESPSGVQGKQQR
jgi:1-acyl-sn-glycerol-3-phosphate acyltransferase